MPGELGNEYMQQGVGYYEHRYDHSGEGGTFMPKTPKNQQQLKRILERIRKKWMDNPEEEER